MKFKVQNPHSKFYPVGRSYVSTREGGSYRGQTGKSCEEEEEEDGSEEEGKQQLGTVGVPLACSLLPGSPGSWSQTSDVPCRVHVYQGVGQRGLGGQGNDIE